MPLPGPWEDPQYVPMSFRSKDVSEGRFLKNDHHQKPLPHSSSSLLFIRFVYSSLSLFTSFLYCTRYHWPPPPTNPTPILRRNFPIVVSTPESSSVSVGSISSTELKGMDTDGCGRRVKFRSNLTLILRQKFETTKYYLMSVVNHGFP